MMNFRKLTLITLAVVLATEITARVVPKNTDDSSQSQPSQYLKEDVQSSKQESLLLEEEKFNIDTSSQIAEDFEVSNPEPLGLVNDLVEDIVAPVLLLDGASSPLQQEAGSKKPGSVFDHLMTFRNNLLGDPSPSPSSAPTSVEPSVALASNTGNVNIDLHYNPVYTVYGHLNSMKDYLLGNNNLSPQMLFQEPPEALKKAKEAFDANLEVVLRGVMEGMLPRVERIRREADSERRTFIDVFINFLGALMGRQQCSQILACR